MKKFPKIIGKIFKQRKDKFFVTLFDEYEVKIMDVSVNKDNLIDFQVGDKFSCNAKKIILDFEVINIKKI